MLLAKVSARNLVNAEIVRRAPAMFTALAPLVGQKILKADGTFFKKFESVLPVLPGTVELHAYYTAGHYSLRACFRACVRSDDGCTAYAEADVYLADLTAGVVNHLYAFNPENYRTDFGFNEVRALQTELKAAKSKVSELESKLAAII